MRSQAHHSQRPRCAPESYAIPARHDIDVLVEEAGTICLFHLVTRRAEAWVNLRPDRGWYTLVGALVVDQSHADAFTQWMRTEGLKVGLTTASGNV